MRQLTQSKESKSLAQQWRIAALWPFLVFLTMFMLGSHSLQAHASKVINENTGASYTDLAIAIAEASAGDILKLEGKFVGTFVIEQTLTLNGSHDATLDGGNAGPVVVVAGAGTAVNLRHLTIKHGLGEDGGGIVNEGSALYLNDVEIHHNIAVGGAGIYNYEGFISLHGCKVHNNSAQEFGGGIANVAGGCDISDSTIKFNAAGVGGGLYNTDGGVTNLYKVKIKGNFGELFGGGIYNSIYSVLNGYQSKILENSALEAGGGLYNIDDAVANLSHSKVTENFVNAANGGGGIFSNSATLTLEDTEVEDNIPNDITEI